MSRPAPLLSHRRYIATHPCHIARLRFLLEAWDNLAQFTVLARYGSRTSRRGVGEVDTRRTILAVWCSPHETRTLNAALAAIGTEVPFTALACPTLEQ